MNDVCIDVKGIKKIYPDFILEDINFEVPTRSILGLIGENGAGKSTLLKSILDLIPKGEGFIEVMSIKDLDTNRDVFEKIGVVLDEGFLPENLNAGKLSIITKSIYKSWDEVMYRDLLKKFKIPYAKKWRILQRYKNETSYNCKFISQSNIACFFNNDWCGGYHVDRFHVIVLMLSLIISIIIVGIGFITKGNINIDDFIFSLFLEISVSLLGGAILIPINLYLSEQKVVIFQMTTYFFTAFIFVGLTYLLKYQCYIV